MNNSSRLALLIGLALLFFVLFQFAPDGGLFWDGGTVGDVLPWIIVGFIVYRFGGGCCSRSCSTKESSDPSS